jgi:four helix bundle protein
MDDTEPACETWTANPGYAMAADPVWRLPAYRLALYALHVGWTDASALSRRSLTAPVGAQLYRALGSVAANLAEGFSRSSGRDRVRLYEYALGSARECVVWYRAALPLLEHVTVERRLVHLQRIVRLLLAVIPRERARNVTKTS